MPCPCKWSVGFLSPLFFTSITASVFSGTRVIGVSKGGRSVWKILPRDVVVSHVPRVGPENRALWDSSRHSVLVSLLIDDPPILEEYDNDFAPALVVFHRSPVLNDIMLSYSENNVKSTKLVLDVPTRWNSTFRMLRTVMQHETTLRRYFEAEYPRAGFPLNVAEMAAMKEVIAGLTHVEKAVQRFSLEAASLTSADLSLQVMLRKLSEHSSSFSSVLRAECCIRILQRRTVASKLARFVLRVEENTPLDGYLEEVRQKLLEEGRHSILRTYLGSDL